MSHNKYIKPAKSSKLRSLTRLVIGAVALGADTLIFRVNEWEKSLSETTIYHEDYRANKIINGELLDESPPRRGKPQSSPFRHALIGFIFETQERIRLGTNLLGRGTRLIGNISEPVLSPIKDHPIFSPLRNRYYKYVARGEAEVARWIEIGRVEEGYSRKLVQTAIDDSVDMSLEYMADNPEVQELIQAQGTGLAFELIEEVRERTVSGDTYLEGVIRSLFWRTPRSDLPGPPNEVRSRALSIRPSKPAKEKKPGKNYSE